MLPLKILRQSLPTSFPSKCTRNKAIRARYTVTDLQQEGLEQAITLYEDDPSLIQEMLIYIYSCDYHGLSRSLSHNAKMYILADKYDVEGLKPLAKHKFSQQLRSHGFTELLNAGLVEAIRIIYSALPISDQGLRHLVLPLCYKHSVELCQNRCYMDLIRSGFADGEFVADVVIAMTFPECVGYDPADKKYRCSNCCKAGDSDCPAIKIHCDDCERLIAWADEA